MEDESQGATYYYLNRIDITVTPYDFWFRGSASWLANVIAHEFTHMVSVQSSFKYPRRIPSLYLQAVNFEKEKRPDVIYGYPNLQVSVPVPGEILPGWFAEGMAQYQCSGACHDMWDSHRDMMLRTAFVERRSSLDRRDGRVRERQPMLPKWSTIRDSRSRASWPGGSARTSFASSLSRSRRSRTWSFDGACERVLGLSGEELYRMWKEDLSAKYGPVVSRVGEREADGEKIAGRGFQNHFPVAGKGSRRVLSSFRTSGGITRISIS